jgi:hypothetical protein
LFGFEGFGFQGFFVGVFFGAFACVDGEGGGCCCEGVWRGYLARVVILRKGGDRRFETE